MCYDVASLLRLVGLVLRNHLVGVPSGIGVLATSASALFEGLGDSCGQIGVVRHTALLSSVKLLFADPYYNNTKTAYCQ